ncbi:MAG: laccase domain-containing protein [Chthoniobacterales bacterium]
MSDRFEPLSGISGTSAAFIPRLTGVDVATDRATALSRLAPRHDEDLRARGFDPDRLATAEQIHRDLVAIASGPGSHAGADALVAGDRNVVLGIYVADCAAVYLADKKGRAIGLVHSGRAGTEMNIVARAIDTMEENFGVARQDIVAEISPCIRPPLYETDFAATIREQAAAAGVAEIRDAGICTGRDTVNYYSYRMERGQTGRMLAVLALRS